MGLDLDQAAAYPPTVIDRYQMTRLEFQNHEAEPCHWNPLVLAQEARNGFRIFLGCLVSQHV